jgi:hypothetical protein
MALAPDIRDYLADVARRIAWNNGAQLFGLQPTASPSR